LISLQGGSFRAKKWVRWDWRAGVCERKAGKGELSATKAAKTSLLGAPLPGSRRIDRCTLRR